MTNFFFRVGSRLWHANFQGPSVAQALGRVAARDLRRLAYRPSDRGKVDDLNPT